MTPSEHGCSSLDVIAISARQNGKERNGGPFYTRRFCGRFRSCTLVPVSGGVTHNERALKMFLARGPRRIHITFHNKFQSGSLLGERMIGLTRVVGGSPPASS